MNDLSVGELLIEANRSIRSLTWDIGAINARGVLAAWPDLAAASRRVLDLLPVPGRTWIDVLDLNPVTVAQTAAPTPAFVDAARLLDRAADLLDAYAPTGISDIEGTKVARASVLLGLHTAAHTATVTLSGHIAAETKRRLPYVSHGAMPTLCRQFRDLEAVLSDENTLAGLGRMRADLPADDVTMRVGQALIRWRATATATLEGTPTRDDIRYVAQTEARLTAYAAAIGAAAQNAGVITEAEAGMFSTSLTGARRGWERLTAAWQDRLVVPRSSNPDLAAESTNVRVALDAATRDGIQWAQRNAVAAKVDLPVVLADLRSAMRGSRAVAEQLTALPERLIADGALHGSSRTLSATLSASPANLTGQALTDTLVNKLIPLRPEHLPALVEPARAQVQLVDVVVAATENLPDGRMAGLTRPAAELARDETALEKLRARVRPSTAFARKKIDTKIRKVGDSAQEGVKEEGKALERGRARARARPTKKPEPSIQSERETENLPQGHLPGFTRPAAEIARDETALEKLPARGRSPAQVDLGDLRARVSSLTERPTSPATLPAQPKVQRRGPQV
jgi:hypothetical protein